MEHTRQIIDGGADNPAVDQSVLILIPVSPTLPRQFLNSCRYLAERAVRPWRRWRIVIDSHGEPPPRGKSHPYRQAALAKIRQNLVDQHLEDFDHVFWPDADIVDYPEDLISQLAARSGGGIAAPVLIMDGKLGDGPAYGDGFGWGRFFDVAGFVENLRWARFERPWFDQPGPVYQLDSVGGCYLVNGEIYREGARYEADPYSLSFIEHGLDWFPEIVARNQQYPANCFTEHFSVCQWAKRRGYPVCAFEDLVAKHAQL